MRLGTYTATRPRGLAAYRPQARARVLISEVHQVLEEYADHLPLTLRQVFYRLVGRFDYPKTEHAYKSLGEVLNRARWVEFRRLAVTPEPVDRYGLPSAPPKRTDRRGGFTGETVQAEALDPATLASEVEEAIRDAVDEPTMRLLAAEETRDRELLIAEIAEVRR